jgi:hypothetical protein
MDKYDSNRLLVVACQLIGPVRNILASDSVNPPCGSNFHAIPLLYDYNEPGNLYFSSILYSQS